MQVTHVVGVDPGLVHSGVVSMLFQPEHRVIRVAHEAVIDLDVDSIQAFIGRQYGPAPHIFIEGYRPRSHFDSDARMVSAVSEMHKALPGSVVLNNTGVKKVVKQELMELLGVWKFSTVTHHQDLRSAARIAVLGMLKDEEMNKLITAVISDFLEGRAWHVHH